MDKKLTILITCYNKEKYISYILGQLIDQNCQEIDVHIIDDASTDNSQSIVKELVDNIDNFYIHNLETNHGTGYVRNYALSLVKTNYFIFIDADDMLVENYVSLLLEKIDKYPDADIIHFCTRVYPLGGKTSLDFSLWDKVISKNFLDNNNITFNPNLINMEDWNLRSKINKVKFNEIHCPEVLYIYNLLAEGTITHQDPIWYNHNLEGIRDECDPNYLDAYNE